MTESNPGNKSPRDPTAPVIGSMVAHYEIKRKIGAGGMGEVYLAEDSRLHRNVALKFLPVHYIEDENFKRRFVREAEATAKLTHPNVVTVHEVGNHNGRPYFVMELVEGQTLKEYAATNELSLEQIVDIAIQVADGLSAAHDHKITHRDVKPSNILIDPYGRPRILDFGLAAIEGSDNLTRTGSTLGTIQYMSPEQAKGHPVDHRTDLFSFGVVIYELLTGSNPFRRDNAVATIQAIITQNPESPGNRRNGLPDSLSAIVTRLMEKDPDHRYQNARDVVADLKLCLRELSSDVMTRSLAASSIKRSQSAKGRGKRFATAVAVAAASIALVVAVYQITDWFMRSDGGSPAAKDRWENAVAVLPFRDFSSTQDQEFFCDGITDAIIGKLSRLSQLKVISMTSVMRYKGADRDLPKIGQELGVNIVLEGSVQREDNRIRIRAQLIDVTADAHLWSQTYDREITSIFEIQDEISLAIADKMKLQLFTSETDEAVDRGTDNVQAYSAYMHGRYAWRKRTERQIGEAIDYFEEAIKLDSGYALAWSGLADAWSVLPGYSAATTEECIPEARKAAVKAVELDPDLAEAHASMGLVLRNERENDGSERSFLRAIEINPGYVWAHTWYAGLLVELEKRDKAAQEFDIALELDPLNMVTINALADLMRFSRNYEEAEKLYLRALSIESNATYRLNYAEMLGNLGRREDAIDQTRIIVEEFPDYIAGYEALGRRLAMAGHLDEAEELIIKYLNNTQDTATALKWRGWLAQNINDHKSAISYFSQAAEKAPDRPDLLDELIEEHKRYREFNAALEAAGRRIEIRPQDFRSYMLRGEVFASQGDFKRAIGDFEKSIEIYADDSWTFRSLAASYMFDGDYESAIEIANKLMRDKNPYNQINGLDIRVAVHVDRGEIDRASEILDSCLTAIDHTEYPRAAADWLLQRVFLEELQERYDSALRNLDSAIILFQVASPSEFLAWKDYRVHLCAQSGDLTMARRFLDELKQAPSERRSPKFSLAISYAEGILTFAEGDTGKALDLLQTSVDSSIYTESVDYFQLEFGLAEVQLKAGLPAAAADGFERILQNYCVPRLSAGFWPRMSQYYLGRAYEVLGNSSEARRMYQEFLDAWGNLSGTVPAVDDTRERLSRLVS